MSANGGQIPDTGRDVLRLRAVVFDALQQVPQFLARPQEALLGAQSMSQDVLYDDEEMLQRQMIRVQHTTVSKGLLQQLLDHQLANIHQIAALYLRRIPGCKWRNHGFRGLNLNRLAQKFASKTTDKLIN